MFWTKTANSLQPCKTQERLGNITDPTPESHPSAWLPLSPSTGANPHLPSAISCRTYFSTNHPIKLFSSHHQWESVQTSCWVVNILHVLYPWCHSFQAPVFWLNSSDGVPMNSPLIASCNLSRLAPKCIIAESYETIWADAASLNN